MSQLLLYDEIKFDRDSKLEDNRKTIDDSDVDYFIAVVIKNIVEKNETTSILS